MKRIFLTILLIVCVYIYIHNPFLFPSLGIFGRDQYQFSIYLLYFAFFFLAIKNYLKIKLFILFFKKELFILFLLVSFSFVRTILGGDVVLFVDSIKSVLNIFFVPSLLVYLAFSAGVETDSGFIRIVLIVGAVGVLFSLFFIAFPELNYIYKLFMLQDNASDSFLEGKRGFGFSSSLTYGYGLVQGAIFAIGLFYIKDHKWFMILLPFMIVSALINARTGVVVAVFGLLIYIVNNKGKMMVPLFVACCILSIVFIYLEDIFVFLDMNPETYKWITLFFDEVTDVATGKSLSEGRTSSVLLGDMFFFPDNLNDWIIGTGQVVFGGEKARNSDIGFINQIFYGGLVYFSILMVFVLNVIKGIRKSGHKLLALFCLVFFLIGNFKGRFAPDSSGFFLIVLLFYYFEFNRKQRELAVLMDKIETKENDNQ